MGLAEGEENRAVGRWDAPPSGKYGAIEGGGVQDRASALGAGLSAASPGGVRAANGGSPVAYGSLPATICPKGLCTLSHRGTKNSGWSDPNQRSHRTVAFLCCQGAS